MPPSTHIKDPSAIFKIPISLSFDIAIFLGHDPKFSELVVMPCTDGKTREEAIRNGEEVIEMYLEAWQAEGEVMPEPRTLQVA